MLTLLVLFVSTKLRADCRNGPAEAQFIAEYEIITTESSSCSIILKNPSLFYPSGVCPLDWVEVDGVELRIDHKSCNYIKSHQIISGTAILRSGLITLEL